VTDTFPRQLARTQRFSLGEPRSLQLSADGQRLVFVRSRTGDDPSNCLWVYDIADGVERCIADPDDLLSVLDDADDNLPPEERARRERAREGAGGVTTFATDAATTVTAFALSGRLFVAGLISGQVRELHVDGPVYDPRPDPLAARLAYVSGRTLRIAELDGTSRQLAGEDDPTISWGSAEFIAAEEIRRFRGFWWSPDGSAIAACRVDTAPVQVWHLADPANPATPPQAMRYPAAGTANADVTLHVLRLDGTTTEIEWDRGDLPYLVNVVWESDDRALVTTQSRDQRRMVVLRADTASGTTEEVWSDTDPQWVEVVIGVPAVLGDGRLVMAGDRDGARRLLVSGEPVTPTDMQVRSVIDVTGDLVTFLANPIVDATVQHVWQWSPDGLTELTSAPGVHTVAVGGGTHVIRRAALDEPTAEFRLSNGAVLPHVIEPPLISHNASFRFLGDRQLATAVLLPHEHDGAPLPVIVDSYAGPHALRVVQNSLALATSQWLADQGFAVVVIDGRGTPGRGSEWERAIHGDLATVVLDDQIDALQAAAEEFPLDLSRVAIRGWSFGGYLAALAVLRRPDIFHAAVAGAPVTEWRLYDTHYTERYLGHPMDDEHAYDRSSLLPEAARLTRPLLLIHGLADDNVVAAHTLRLSSALLAAGRHHEVLPLVGVSHMTPQEVVTENLLLHQLSFINRSLNS
jgi:dipeptidyl-peptidase 4